jgi:hypothetical protein
VTTSSTFGATADGYVDAAAPSTNYGTTYDIRSQAASGSTSEMRSYLRFDLSGLSGTVTAATLQLYSYTTWAGGMTVSTTGGGWTEYGLDFSNAPPVGTAAGSSGALVVNTTASVDVTPAVTGNGTVDLVITTDRTSKVKFASRESSVYMPVLVVETTSGAPSPSPSSSVSPSPSSSVSPSPSPSPSGISGPTIVAAGDISCPQGDSPTSTSCQQLATSDLAIAANPDAVLPLGDEQYELGSLADFQAMYQPSWGRLNAISRPAPGNHEYGYIGTAIIPTGGEGYFTYFGDRSHPLQPGCTTNCVAWYSWDIGNWHMISLDSQCLEIGGCNPGNPEYKWLQADLEANTKPCTLAYWHIPVYSSSQDHQPDMTPMYQLLYTKKADVVLNGHAHFYERFAPQDAAGNADPVNGISEFIVGSGGKSFFNIRTTPAANSVARIANTFGVLKMTLGETGYSWQFLPVAAGGSTDSGTAACH